jgi:hypothetical protein
MKLLINERDHAVEGAFVSLRPCLKKPGDLGGVVRNDGHFANLRLTAEK